MNEEEKKAIEKISNEEKIELTALIRKFKREGIENFIVTRPEYIYTILNLIEKQQKEIEELRERVKEYEKKLEKINKQLDLDYVDDNYILKSKIQEKIKEYENILKKCNNKKDIDRIKCLNERILAYKELL